MAGLKRVRQPIDDGGTTTIALGDVRKDEAFRQGLAGVDIR